MFTSFKVPIVIAGLLLHLVAVGTVTADESTNLPVPLEFLARENGQNSEGVQPPQQWGNSGNYWLSLNPTGDFESIFTSFLQQLKEAQLQQLERQEIEIKKWQASTAQLFELWKSAVASARKRFEWAEQLWAQDAKESEKQWNVFWDWAKTLLPSDLHDVGKPPESKENSQKGTIRKVKQVVPTQEPKDLLSNESSVKEKVKKAIHEAEFLLSSLENQQGILASAQSEPETIEPTIHEKGFLQQQEEEVTPPEAQEGEEKPQTEEQNPEEVEVIATENQSNQPKDDEALSAETLQILPEPPLEKEMERLIVSIDEALKRVTYTTFALRRALESAQSRDSHGLKDSRKLETGLQKMDGLNASFLASNSAVKAELAALDTLQMRQKSAQVDEILDLQQKRIRLLKRWLLRINVQQLLLLELLDKSGVDSAQVDGLPIQKSPDLDAGLGSEATLQADKL